MFHGFWFPAGISLTDGTMGVDEARPGLKEEEFSKVNGDHIERFKSEGRGVVAPSAGLAQVGMALFHQEGGRPRNALVCSASRMGFRPERMVIKYKVTKLTVFRTCFVEERRRVHEQEDPPGAEALANRQLRFHIVPVYTG